MTSAADKPAPARIRTSVASLTLLHTTVPAYRKPFLEMLDARLDHRLRVLAGDEYFDSTIRRESTQVSTTVVRNRYLLGRRLLWQSRALPLALSAEVLVSELNPRVVSTWVLLVMRRSLGRPTLLWGHAWPLGGARRGRLRSLMRRTADGVIVYTETEARDLRTLMTGSLVTAAPNALYPHAARIEPGDLDGGSATDFVYVGRLVEEKQPGLLLDAFVAAVDELPPETRLVFVGDGPLKPTLEAVAASSRVQTRVHFMGPHTDPEVLRVVYARAIASASPGPVGLALIQSLWFGVPCIIADDLPHRPEIEAAIEGENAIFFAEGSVDSLRAALLAVARERQAWTLRRAGISSACASRYTLDGMVDAILDAVDAVAR